MPRKKRPARTQAGKTYSSKLAQIKQVIPGVRLAKLGGGKLSDKGRKAKITRAHNLLFGGPRPAVAEYKVKALKPSERKTILKSYETSRKLGFLGKKATLVPKGFKRIDKRGAIITEERRGRIVQPKVNLKELAAHPARELARLAAQRPKRAAYQVTIAGRPFGPTHDRESARQEIERLQVQYPKLRGMMAVRFIVFRRQSRSVRSYKRAKAKR